MKKRFTSIILAILLLVCAGVCCACDEQIIDHQIIVTSSNILYGQVTGADYYKTKQQVTLTATPNADNTFVCWTKDNVIVSTEAEYTFVASKQTEGKYVAIFFGEIMQTYALKNVKIEYNSADTNTSNTYQFMHFDITQKTSSDNQILSQDMSESFYHEDQNWSNTYDIDTNLVYTVGNENYFVFTATIIDPNAREQVYSNNFIVSPIQSLADNDGYIVIKKTLSCSDSNLIVMVSFAFAPLGSNITAE